MNNIQMSFVGTEGTGKTVLVSVLAMRNAWGTCYFHSEDGATVAYTQRNWATLQHGQWPASTPPDEFRNLHWTLRKKIAGYEKTLCHIRFADCAGQDIRNLFSDGADLSNLTAENRQLNETLRNSQILVFLLDLQTMVGDDPQVVENQSLFVKMLWELHQHSFRIAVVFTQYDKYKPFIDKHYSGDVLQYLKSELPELYGEYENHHSFSFFPVSAVSSTRMGTVANGELDRLPETNFTSTGLEPMMDWLCQSARELQEKPRKKLFIPLFLVFLAALLVFFVAVTNKNESETETTATAVAEAVPADEETAPAETEVPQVLALTEEDRNLPKIQEFVGLLNDYYEIIKIYAPTGNRAKALQPKMLALGKEIHAYYQLPLPGFEATRQGYIDDGMYETATEMVEIERKIEETKAKIEAWSEESLQKTLESKTECAAFLEMWRVPEAGDLKVVNVNGIEYRFRFCPAGSFMMGSPESEEDRDYNETQHEVTLKQGFWLLETEVTVGMFRSFVKQTGYTSKGNIPYGWTGGGWIPDSKYSWQNPSFSQTENCPVTCVSWDDAQAFSEWLGKQVGLPCSLPTEAQWEYACRAGTTGAYAGNLDEMGWYDFNSGKKTHAVGQKKPNAWGLYDMHGNVWEWCLDWYDSGYYAASPTSDPLNSKNGSNRVYRGGSWNSDAGNCRSAYRYVNAPDNRFSDLGFRPLLVLSCPGSGS